MKKIIGALCIIFFLYIALKGCDHRSEEAKLVHHAMYNVMKTLDSRYQLHFIGRVEAEDEGHYTTIGLKFQIFHILSKDEGRKMLIDCIGELLKEINSNQKLLPYLQPSPFTVDNIELSIFVYYPDGKFAYSPEIGVFSCREGIIRFGTNAPKPGYIYGHYSYEKESYEEALKIVESKAKAN